MLQGESHPYLTGVGDAVAVAAALCRGCVDRDDGHVLPRGKGGRRLDEGRSVPKSRAQTSLLGQDLLVRHGVDGVREAECRAAAVEGEETMRDYFKQRLALWLVTD